MNTEKTIVTGIFNPDEQPPVLDDVHGSVETPVEETEVTSEETKEEK